MAIFFFVALGGDKFKGQNEGRPRKAACLLVKRHGADIRQNLCGLDKHEGLRGIFCWIN